MTSAAKKLIAEATPVMIVGSSKQIATYRIIVVLLLILNTLAVIVILGNQNQQWRQSQKVKVYLESFQAFKSSCERIAPMTDMPVPEVNLLEHDPQQ